jgi:prephenate dehydrogenase
MQRVAIFGVGLIGASFGLALRKAGFRGSIVGVSSERSIAAAVERSAIDHGATFDEAASTADLIFLSQPILGIIETIGKLSSVIRRDALVTDAGSTKLAITTAAKQSLGNCAFVGGHPMAGKEQRGAEAADAGLFRDRPWILTSSGDHPVELELRHWIGKIGARITVLDAELHDRLVAWSSHLPQLASTALAAALNDRRPDAAAVAGPGLNDMTRLAMSSYDLWRDILGTNQREVVAALDAYIDELQKVRARISEGAAEDEFTRGSKFARSLRDGKSGQS